MVGAANNQLATDAVGADLLRRGIVYAPDYVVNAGGSSALRSNMKADMKKRMFGHR